jgi:UrcA family protein
MHKSLLAVVAAAAAALPGVASAAPQIEERSISVAYADLAVEKRAGTETLNRRVEAAVQSVCVRPVTMRDLKGMRNWQACRDTALSEAREQIAADGQVKVAARF